MPHTPIYHLKHNRVQSNEATLPAWTLFLPTARSFRNLLARVVKKRDPASSLLLSAHDCSVGRLDLHLTVCVCWELLRSTLIVIDSFGKRRPSFLCSPSLLDHSVHHFCQQSTIYLGRRGKHNHWNFRWSAHLLSVSHLTCLLHLSSCS